MPITIANSFVQATTLPTKRMRFLDLTLPVNDSDGVEVYSKWSIDLPLDKFTPRLITLQLPTIKVARESQRT